MQSMVLGVRETEKRLVRKEYSRSLGLVGARFSLGRAHSGRIGRNRLRPTLPFCSSPPSSSKPILNGNSYGTSSLFKSLQALSLLIKMSLEWCEQELLIKSRKGPIGQI